MSEISDHTELTIDALLYKQPPNPHKMLISDLSQACLNRIQLLKFIKQPAAGPESQLKLKEKSKELKLDIFSISKESPQYILNDLNSHFLLRYAFCMNDDLRQYFIESEVKLFVSRLKNDSKIEIIKHLLKSKGVSYEVSKEEEEKYCFRFGDDKYAKIEFFKIPFYLACHALCERKYYLKDGYIYLPQGEVYRCAGDEFKYILLQGLEKAQKNLVTVQSDPRVKELLERIRAWHANMAYDYQKNPLKGKIALSNLDAISKKFFPPCMRVLYEQLKINHHLRHDGRLQLGLFLKGIGLTLEDSIILWKREFTKGKISEEEFNKEYLYNIKHNYGKEGKRTDYSPWACTKIINLTPPGNNEYHSCPFKHFSVENIQKLLKMFNVKDEAIGAILQEKKQFQYQVACTRLFENLFPETARENAGNHPNAFFSEAYGFYEKNNIKYNKKSIGESKKSEKMEIKEPSELKKEEEEELEKLIEEAKNNEEAEMMMKE